MTGRFAPRPTSPTGEIAINAWRLKTYEITLDGAPIDRSVIAAANAYLADTLPTSGPDGGVGFLIVHHGSEQV